MVTYHTSIPCPPEKYVNLLKSMQNPIQAYQQINDMGIINYNSWGIIWGIPSSKQEKDYINNNL